MRNFKEEKINPLDFEPNVAIGMGLPFTSDGVTFFQLNYTTAHQIRDDLKNLLLTYKGERYMLPEYGTNLKRIIFENTDKISEQDIEDDINEAVLQWLPIVNIKKIDFDTDFDEHKINMTITYNTKFDLDFSSLILGINI